MSLENYVVPAGGTQIILKREGNKYVIYDRGNKVKVFRSRSKANRTAIKLRQARHTEFAAQQAFTNPNDITRDLNRAQEQLRCVTRDLPDGSMSISYEGNPQAVRNAEPLGNRLTAENLAGMRKFERNWVNISYNPEIVAQLTGTNQAFDSNLTDAYRAMEKAESQVTIKKVKTQNKKSGTQKVKYDVHYVDKNGKKCIKSFTKPNAANKYAEKIRLDLTKQVEQNVGGFERPVLQPQPASLTAENYAERMFNNIKTKAANDVALQRSLQRINQKANSNLQKASRQGNKTVLNPETGLYESTNRSQASLARYFEETKNASQIDALQPYRHLKQKSGIGQNAAKSIIENATEGAGQNAAKSIIENAAEGAGQNAAKSIIENAAEGAGQNVANKAGSLRRAGKWGAIAAGVLALGTAIYTLAKCSGEKSENVKVPDAKDVKPEVKAQPTQNAIPAETSTEETTTDIAAKEPEDTTTVIPVPINSEEETDKVEESEETEESKKANEDAELETIRAEVGETYWGYAKLELIMEHQGETGYTPTNKEIAIKCNEIMKRNGVKLDKNEYYPDPMLKIGDEVQLKKGAREEKAA